MTSLIISNHQVESIQKTIVPIITNLNNWINETIGFSPKSIQNVYACGIFEGLENTNNPYFRNNDSIYMNKFSDKLMAHTILTMGTAHTILKVYKEYKLYCILLIELNYKPSKIYYNINGEHIPQSITLSFENQPIMSKNITFNMENIHHLWK